MKINKPGSGHKTRVVFSSNPGRVTKPGPCCAGFEAVICGSKPGAGLVARVVFGQKPGAGLTARVGFRAGINSILPSFKPFS